MRMISRLLVILAVSTSLAAALPVSAQTLTVPRAGSPIDRVEQLWQQTRTILRADAQAALSDGEAAQRQRTITEAWRKLKVDLRNAQVPDNVREILFSVMTLIGRVYHRPSTVTTSPKPTGDATTTTKAKPQEFPQTSIDGKIQRIDQMIAAARGR